MKYLIERSLYYYFLMREAIGADISAWNYIAKQFGVKQKDIKSYESVLSIDTLAQLKTVDDIEMYSTFLEGFGAENEFGKAENERDAIGAKGLALHKTHELFGDSPISSNRLRTLSPYS